MKKLKFLSLVLLTTIAFVSCKNSFGLNIEEETEEKVDVNVQNLLSKTRVNLFTGVEISDLGISDESRENRLVSEISRKANRSVNSAEPIIELEKVAEILNETVSSLDIPELLEPTQEDIAKIQKTFLDLTEEEIIENLDTISRIYQDEISALTMPQIVCNVDLSENSLNSRAIKIKDWKIYYDDVPITSYIVSAMLKHPFSAIGIINQKKLALDYTKKYMGDGPNGDNKKDAFRHAIWNIVMCKEGWGKKNQKLSWARDFATAYEKGENYTEFTSDMDLHNNKVGRSYYSENSTKTYKKFLWWQYESGVSEPSYEIACSAIKQKAIKANFIGMTDSDFTEKLNSENENTLIYVVEDNNQY